ncbi:MAG: hypothetical protein HN742_07685 [Lentisphaerae bacterium]|jgi:galactose mutarotase-like enzyme|nr:hypothetical protein [Lentisphaerota bacterium]MBT4817457.1 hypothetical protein [Lentisphaerota bacterium]MBT5606185.1 hypothetical protein [Lentisphaerota bacterium]MBT7057869.1 hypothetical protein [Lentisphaerota bacterium]MBT7841737.1 hypothetical protein [Lentisphaerota bacterium]
MQTKRLELPDNSASVTIAEDFGCNAFSWQVSGRELLYTCEGFGADPADFYHGGIPLLFPSVGRTWDQSVTPPAPDRYRIHGQTGAWTMPCHGILPFGNWDLVREETTPDAVTVEYRFHCEQKVLTEQYPYKVGYTQRFRLRQKSLEMTAVYVNEGSTPAPVAFGYHPYFRLESAVAALELPCTESVELNDELLIPSGGTTSFGGALDIRTEQDCDAVFGGINGSQARLVDADAGRVITVEIDPDTAHMVVYSGADCPFVCIEPWTGGLGGYGSLQTADWIQNQPVPVIQPGEERSFLARYGVEPI